MTTAALAVAILILVAIVAYLIWRPQPSQKTVPAYTVNSSAYVSPNFNSRPSGMAIAALVLHTTEGSFPGDCQWMCNPSSQVSTHYVIPPSGTTIYRLVADAKRAWHAGESTYAGRSNWNDFSIGIEISHIEGQTWPPGQKDLTAALCRDLIATYHIPQEMVSAHRWVATPAGRKRDPTNWNDAELSAWIASLYGPSYTPVIVTAPCAVLTGPSPDAALASGPNNGQTWLMPGDTVNCGSISEGWAHVSDSAVTPPGIGFVCASYVRRL